MDKGSLVRFARLVRELRGADSLQVFAARLGVGASTVNAWEKGATEPSLDNLFKIAKLAGYSPQELLAYLSEKSDGPDLAVTVVVDRIRRADLEEIAEITKAAAARVAELAATYGKN